jgi:hypothetical protein
VKSFCSNVAEKKRYRANKNTTLRDILATIVKIKLKSMP